jgi:hypothetical protein
MNHNDRRLQLKAVGAMIKILWMSLGEAAQVGAPSRG